MNTCTKDLDKGNPVDVIQIEIKPLYFKSSNLYISRFISPVHKVYDNLIYDN